MNDALFYESKPLACDVIPYQQYTEIRWQVDQWANRYAIFKTTDKRRLLGHSESLGFYHDRSNDALVGDYEVIAERIGDISFEDGGIRMIADERLDAQDMMIRMESEKGDWKNHEEMGASLSQFIGMRNNQETASDIEEAVSEALLYGDRFDDIDVRVVPTADDRLSVFTFADQAVASKEVEL